MLHIFPHTTLKFNTNFESYSSVLKTHSYFLNQQTKGMTAR